MHHRIFFFLFFLNYFHTFNIYEIRYVGPIRRVESKYPTILTLILDRKFCSPKCMTLKSTTFHLCSLRSVCGEIRYDPAKLRFFSYVCAGFQWKIMIKDNYPNTPWPLKCSYCAKWFFKLCNKIVFIDLRKIIWICFVILLFFTDRLSLASGKHCLMPDNQPCIEYL